jgi:hypothetical protein
MSRAFVTAKLSATLPHRLHRYYRKPAADSGDESEENLKISCCWQQECPAFENREGWGQPPGVPRRAAKLGQPPTAWCPAPRSKAGPAKKRTAEQSAVRM